MKPAVLSFLALLCVSGCREAKSHMAPYDLAETMAHFRRGGFGPVEQSFVRAYEVSSQCMGLPTSIVFPDEKSRDRRHGRVVLFSFGPPERIHYLRVADAAHGAICWIVKVDTTSYRLNLRVGGMLMRETDVVVAKSWDAPSVLASGFPIEEVKRADEISVELFDVNKLPLGNGAVLKRASKDGVLAYYFKEVLPASPAVGLTVPMWPRDGDGNHQPLRGRIGVISP